MAWGRTGVLVLVGWWANGVSLPRRPCAVSLAP